MRCRAPTNYVTALAGILMQILATRATQLATCCPHSALVVIADPGQTLRMNRGRLDAMIGLGFSILYLAATANRSQFVAIFETPWLATAGF
jgi:hypothetical protein